MSSDNIELKYFLSERDTETGSTFSGETPKNYETMVLKILDIRQRRTTSKFPNFREKFPGETAGWLQAE
jgi:hypothetical protein